MLTSRTARWTAATTLLCVALVALSWLFLVSPKRDEAAALREQNASAQSQNDLLEVKIAQLRAQFAKLPQSQAELAAILAQIPPDAGMPRLVRDLDSMAKSTGVTLTSVTPGGATTMSAPTASGAPAAVATGAVGGAAGAGGTGTAAGAASDSAQVVQIPVTVAIDGDYFQTVAFLKQLQTQMPRAFLVTAVQMNAGGGAASTGTTGQVSVTVTGKVFALPGMSADVLTTAASGGATAKSPIGAATAQPTAGATAAATAGTAGAAAATTPATTAVGSTQEVS